MAKHTIDPDFIAAKVAETKAAAPESRRNRIFYDAHKNAPAGFGVRITKAGGVSFVLNYYSAGAERRATVGKHGPSPGLSITAARAKAARIRTTVLAGGDPVGERRAEKAEKAAAAEAKRQREQHTLAALVAAYIADLRQQGKPERTARDYENLFRRAVSDPFPKIAAMPLDEVTVSGVMPVFHRLAKGGSVRDPEKLVSLLRAAFNNARAAASDSRRHAYSEFLVTVNPLADLRVSRNQLTPEEAQTLKAEKYWTLTPAQLAAYWKRIAAQDDSYGAMLRLHLLTGGQRREQLVRLTRRGYDAGEGTITLWDNKGRRRKRGPREHKLPLLPEAEAALLAMAGDKGPHLVTIDGGASPVSVDMLSKACARVSDAMIKAGEVSRPVTPGAIRRSVETLLGQASVFKEIRAQLQSHGLSGVQEDSYDMGDYLEHKREALEKLRALCEPKPDNVTPIRRKA